jgi:hypothetical protein
MVAASEPLAPAATGRQCNNTGAVGGDTINCTTTITNDFTCARSRAPRRAL